MDDQLVREAIRKKLLEDLTPVNPLPSDAHLLAGMQATAATGIGGFLTLMGVRGWALMTLSQTLAMSILILLFGACFAAMVLRLIRPGATPLPVRAEVAVGLLCVSFPAVCGSFFPAVPTGHALRNGMICMGGGVMLTVIVCPVLFRIARRGAILDGTRIGASVGAFSGLISAAALQLFCPHQAAGHLALWHGLVVVMSIAGGIVCGRRFEIR